MAEPDPVPATSHARRWPHAWWVFLLVGAPVVVAYQVLPKGRAVDLAYVLSGAMGIAAVLLGLHLHRPRRHGAWLALALSQTLWVLGDVVGTVQTYVAPTEAFPTVVDVFYLAGYPVLGLSLFLLTRGRRPAWDVEGALDALTVTVGLYLLCWVLLAGPTSAEYRDSALAAVVGATYPLLDITVIAMLAVLAISPGTHTGSLRLLCIAIALVIIADTAATALGLLSFNSTDPLDLIWMVSYLLVGAAALHPSVYELSGSSPAEQPRISGRRQIATTLAVMVAPGTLAVEHALDRPVDIWPVVIASVVMFLLVVARMNLVIRQMVVANRLRDQAQHELAHEATHDSLTGLPNRGQALGMIGASLSRAQRSGALIGLLFIDLDGFKAVNDTFGHRAGDEVLREVARRMQRAVRGGDVVGRLGGDEFVVLLEPVVEEKSAVEVGQRLIAAIARPVELSNGQLVGVGASVGVAISQDGQTDSEVLLAEADTAAYQAKSLGKGRTEVFDSALRRELQARSELEAGLRRALAEDHLLLRYRPVVHLESGRAVGYEAVAHWRRPGAGLVPVPELRGTAELSDLILDLDAWALRRAARQIADWTREGRSVGQVSVRVSVRHTVRSRLLDDVRRAVEEAGIEPRQLVVQVSDTGFVDDPVSFDNLSRLRAMGTTVSLDDFGVGYSSIRRLARLPVDAVKLDGSLLEVSSATAEGLLELMVRGVQNFGLRVVVKGVQDSQQLAVLRSIDCELGQGDLLGGLVDADQVGLELARSVAQD